MVNGNQTRPWQHNNSQSSGETYGTDQTTVFQLPTDPDAIWDAYIHWNKMSLWEYFLTGCTESCQNDNFRSSQLRIFLQNGENLHFNISVDMLITKEGDQCLLTDTSIIKQSRAVGTWSSMARYWVRHCPYGLLARYVKLRVAHASGMPGMFSPPPRVSDPGMHHGTCVTHVTLCMPGSLTRGFLWSRWRGKRYRHCRCMRNPQFYVSGKRPIDEKRRSDFEQTSHSSPSMGCLLWVFWEKINRDIKVVRILFLNKVQWQW